MRNLFKPVLGLFVLSTLFFTSCDPEENYTIPTTYNFDNVSYNGQTQRLQMLAELKSYVSTGNTMGTVLDAAKMKAMFANTDGAGFTGTYEDSKQLKSKTFEAEQTVYEALMDAAAVASTSTSAASDGTAGVITSPDGEKNYLVSAGGVEYNQIIEKGLMGACFYYQATTIYMGDSKMGEGIDNETVIDGEGTEMEHHWDEAFGYFGAPIDFPINLDGLQYWANYSNTVNAPLGTNQRLMDELLRGRAAISNKDLETRDAAISAARTVWEEVTAGAAGHYINSALANAGDDARRVHALSEAAAFAYAIKFNEGKSVTNAQVDEVLTLLGGSADFLTMNFYNTTDTDLNAAMDKLQEFFGWSEDTAGAL